jgi:hypothetical protein
LAQLVGLGGLTRVQWIKENADAALAARPIAAPQGMGAPPSAAGGIAPIDPVKLLKKYVWLLAITGVVGIAMGIAGQILLEKYAPSYTAEVLFEVRPREISPTDFAAATDLNAHERIMQTEARFMTEEQILRLVVDDPRLRNEAPDWYASVTSNGQFDKREAFRTLRKSVRSAAINNTTTAPNGTPPKSPAISARISSSSSASCRIAPYPRPIADVTSK